jgi:hypothetical protein
LDLQGEVVAREAETLRVLVQMSEDRELLYLTAASAEIFGKLYPGRTFSLRIEDARIVSCVRSE